MDFIYFFQLRTRRIYNEMVKCDNPLGGIAPETIVDIMNKVIGIVDSIRIRQQNLAKLIPRLNGYYSTKMPPMRTGHSISGGFFSTLDFEQYFSQDLPYIDFRPVKLQPLRIDDYCCIFFSILFEVSFLAPN